jgi:hypothetical protein
MIPDAIAPNMEIRTALAVLLSVMLLGDDDGDAVVVDVSDVGEGDRVDEDGSDDTVVDDVEEERVNEDDPTVVDGEEEPTEVLVLEVGALTTSMKDVETVLPAMSVAITVTLYNPTSLVALICPTSSNEESEREGGAPVTWSTSASPSGSIKTEASDMFNHDPSITVLLEMVEDMYGSLFPTPRL